MNSEDVSCKMLIRITLKLNKIKQTQLIDFGQLTEFFVFKE